MRIVGVGGDGCPLIPSHRNAVHTRAYTLFQTSIPFSGRPFSLHEVLKMFSGLVSQLFGQVWLALIDVAACVGVPDVHIARDFV
jgi:hypothetical protein